MSITNRILKAAWTANRVERAMRSPGRYTKNRVKSKAMSRVGFWSAWRRWWRA